MDDDLTPGHRRGIVRPSSNAHCRTASRNSAAAAENARSHLRATPAHLRQRARGSGMNGVARGGNGGRRFSSPERLSVETQTRGRFRLCPARGAGAARRRSSRTGPIWASHSARRPPRRRTFSRRPYLRDRGSRDRASRRPRTATAPNPRRSRQRASALISIAEAPPSGAVVDNRSPGPLWRNRRSNRRRRRNRLGSSTSSRASPTAGPQPRPASTKFFFSSRQLEIE